MNPPPDIWYLIGLLGTDNKGEGRVAFDKLVEMGGSAVGPLIHSLESEFIEEPLWSAIGSLLAVIGSSSVLPLIEVAQDSGLEEYLRAEAVSILGYIGDQRAVQPLIDLERVMNFRGPYEPPDAASATQTRQNASP
jgi:HEAT repeat protein